MQYPLQKITSTINMKIQTKKDLILKKKMIVILNLKNVVNGMKMDLKWE